MTKCNTCGIDLFSRVSIRVGICLDCRARANWTSCTKCGKHTTIEPLTGNCMNCLRPADPPKPMQTQTTPKNYGNQCPCGIHPDKCTYHAGSV